MVKVLYKGKSIGLGNNVFYLGMIFYRITLDLIYTLNLSNLWNYMGFENGSSAIWKIISWFFFLLWLPLIEKYTNNENVPTNVIMLFLHLIAFVPGLVLIAYQPTNVFFCLLYLLYWLLLNVAYMIIRPISIRKLPVKISFIFTEAILIIFCLTVLLVWIYYTNFRITVNLVDVYSIRGEAASYNYPSVVAYVLAASRSVIPCLCIYKLARKQYVAFIFLAIVQLINFSIDGLKSAIFALIIAVPLYYIYNNGILKKIPILFGIVNALGLFEMFLLDTQNIIAVLIRRVFFLPQLLNYDYYDFFSKNEFDYFRQTILRYLGLHSPYSSRIPFVIGNYRGTPSMYANNGLWSDAYSNLGVLGIIIMPFVTIATIKLIDSVSKEINIRLIIGAIISCTMSLIGSNLSVFFITQGFLFTCIAIYLFPINIHYKEKGFRQ